MNENDNFIGTVLDGRYEILDLIGEGGMARVYKARDTRLERLVAVKIMREDMAADEEVRRRFVAESHAVAMLSNNNIVAIYDVSHSDAMEYIVMELVDGITLQDYMDRKGALPWREVLHFSKQIASALDHAHRRGIIHRDIKPQNIMLLRNGTIKVADFGIAALENEMEESDGEAVGSIYYIAPEQARGEAADARSDVYSLGIVMYHMLTGERPYTGSTLGEVAVKHMNAKPTPPHELQADIPEGLEQITLKAMDADISRRYQSARELLDDLELFTQDRLRAAEEPPEEDEALENPSVVPIRSVSELSADSYRRRRRRSSRVSYLTGSFGVLLAAVLLLGFLWRFWLTDIFAPAERLSLPNFVGSSYDALVSDPQLNSLYNFEVIFVPNLEQTPGVVLSQSPSAGRSMMVTPDGINVEISVSTGNTQNAVPEVLNMDYRSASALLRQAGFYVELQNTVSDSYTRDYVVRCDPEPGTELGTGSTVTLLVSSGPQISYVTMPNLIGLSENAAISQIENNRLSYGGSEYAASDLAAGTVIGQSTAAFGDVEVHSKITLRVSTGPVNG